MKQFATPAHAARSNPDRAPNRQLWRVERTVGLLVACLFLAGCAVPVRQTGSHSPDCRAEYVYLYWPTLPADVKRVAVLPLACEAWRTDLADGCEALAPILEAELVKTKKFEMIPVNPEILRNRTGRPKWTGAEVLPQEFLNSLREVYGCDAVLFCQLTAFRAYAPLAVGWRMRLVEVRTRQTLWAADEIFDAGQQVVMHGAAHYQFFEQQTRADAPEDWFMRNSPRRFGQYTVAQLIATLPDR